MMLELSRLLPVATVSKKPHIVPFYFFLLITVISTVRSLIHMLASDGGAHSIAGLAVDIAGGQNLIALFAQWGASQLVLAVLYWVVIVRYRFLTPLMIASIILEQVLRIGMAALKPIVVATPPPGAYYSHALLPIACVMLVWSLWPSRGPAGDVGSVN